MKNKFCDSSHLTNEASVEDLFVGRLLRDLGYQDGDIAQKASIPAEQIMLGSRRTRFAPDYILSVAGKPRVVVDAKAPEENPAAWTGQCVSYCAKLNRRDDAENPVRFFCVTNGFLTLVYSVDHEVPLVFLEFSDFKEGNAKFSELKSLLSPLSVVTPEVAPDQKHEFKRLRLDEVNSIFSWCHQNIYRKDNLSQAAGFEEFVKLIFLKLLSDRQIRDRYGPLVKQESLRSQKRLSNSQERGLMRARKRRPTLLMPCNFSSSLLTLKMKYATIEKSGFSKRKRGLICIQEQ